MQQQTAPPSSSGRSVQSTSITHSSTPWPVVVGTECNTPGTHTSYTNSLSSINNTGEDALHRFVVEQSHISGTTVSRATESLATEATSLSASTTTPHFRYNYTLGQFLQLAPTEDNWSPEVAVAHTHDPTYAAELYSGGLGQVGRLLSQNACSTEYISLLSGGASARDEHEGFGSGRGNAARVSPGSLGLQGLMLQSLAGLVGAETSGAPVGAQQQLVVTNPADPSFCYPMQLEL